MLGRRRADVTQLSPLERGGAGELGRAASTTYSLPCLCLLACLLPACYFTCLLLACYLLATSLACCLLAACLLLATCLRACTLQASWGVRFNKPEEVEHFVRQLCGEVLMAVLTQ